MSEQKTFPYVHITENAVMPQLDAGTQFTDTRVQAMIDEAMRHVHATMNVMLQRLETMDAKINLLDKKVKSGNRNVVARSENIAVLHGNMKLNPLYSLQTGKPIVGFPRTISDLNELSATAVIDMLRQLDIVPNGDSYSRRRQLKLAIGIVLKRVE